MARGEAGVIGVTAPSPVVVANSQKLGFVTVHNLNQAEITVLQTKTFGYQNSSSPRPKRFKKW